MQITISSFLQMPAELFNETKVLSFFDPECDDDFNFLSNEVFFKLCDLIPQHNQLSWLELCEHNIGGLSREKFKKLCDSIASCNNLLVLDLSNNVLNKLDVGSLEYFSTSLIKCINLHTLILENNKFGHLDASKLVSLFKGLGLMPNMKILNLSYNRLGYLNTEDFNAFGSQILNHSQLEKINFSSNNFNNDNKLLLLMLLLKQSNKIIELNLSNNNLGEVSDNIINDLYSLSIDLSSLKFLKLEDNALATAPRLIIFFISIIKLVDDLDLSNNNLFKLSNQDFILLFNHIASFSHLKKLSLTDNNFGCLTEEQLTNLSQFFIKCNHIENLDISFNNLYELPESGFNLLFNSLTQNSELKVLNLSFNNLGKTSNSGIMCLIGLLKNRNFIELNLSENFLGELDIHNFNLLCEALGSCNDLRILNLGANNFSNLPIEGVNLLCITVRRLVNLEKFNISDNNFSNCDEEQLKCLLKVFADSPSLTKLDLSYIFDDGVLQQHFMMFDRFLRQSTNLKSLKLEGNGIGDAEYQEMEQIITTNRWKNILKLKI